MSGIILNHIFQAGVFILVAGIIFVLALCWMFRHVLTRVIEQLFHIDPTLPEKDPLPAVKAPPVPDKSQPPPDPITIHVENVNIYAPINPSATAGHEAAEQQPEPPSPAAAPPPATAPEEPASPPAEAAREPIAPHSEPPPAAAADSPAPRAARRKMPTWYKAFLIGCVWFILFLISLPPADKKAAESPAPENLPAESSAPAPESTALPAAESPASQNGADSLAAPPPPAKDPPPVTGIHKDLKGRGESDVGRNEPQYVGVIGYIAVSHSDLTTADAPYETPWPVKTYAPDKQFWNETDTPLEHKTEVVVKNQMLKHRGYSYYVGYLCVQRRSDGQEFYIDVNNFITKPYWTYSDPIAAAREGDYLAVFQQRSDYYPVDRNNKKVDIPDGTVVFISGPTGTYGRGGPDKRTHPLGGSCWREDKQRYGAVFFSQEDLQIQY